MPFLPPNQQRQSTEGKALKAPLLVHNGTQWVEIEKLKQCNMKSLLNNIIIIISLINTVDNMQPEQVMNS